MPEPREFLPVGIIGGGVTGLAAAWHLTATGRPAIVFEAAGRVGGAVQSLRTGEWLHEGGPNSLLEDAASAALIDAAGLGERRLIAAPAAKRRYIVWRGHLEPLPGSPIQFCRTPLFSASAKLRLAGEFFRGRGPADDVESLAAFTERRLGREFLDYAIDPFVAGVYAGDPRKLSVRHAFPKLHALEQKHGSLLRGALAQRNASGGPRGRMVSFPEGLAELPQALARPLGGAVRLGARVSSVGRQGAVWTVRGERDGHPFEERCAAVICAAPADTLAALRFDGSAQPFPLAPLGEIEQPPVASVFLGFKRSAVAHPLDGFGFLAPRREARWALGVLFSSTLFPERCPPGHVALTTMMGGSRQPEIAAMDDASLVRLARTELAELLGARDGPVFASVRRHAHAIPQYNLGYWQYLLACADAEAAEPGLFIGGNVRDGISLSACLSSGRRLADAAADFLRR